MATNSIPATFMRGGTSKALMIKAEHLPTDKTQWKDLLCSMMGSPDQYGRQLNGMGGGVSSVSKVCVIAKSERPDADVDFTFVQVQVFERAIDMSGNCGNMLSAVGPYAVDEGLVAVQGDEAFVRIYNTNTQKIMHSRFPIKNGQSVYEGDLQIPGVSGTGAPIRLDFIDPAGATTGSFLPTGSVVDILTLPDGTQIEASLFDVANACVILRARDVGLTGYEQPEDIENRSELMLKLAEIRIAGSQAMKISRSREEALSKAQVPFIALVSEAKTFLSASQVQILAEDMDFNARVISAGQPHRALPLTITLCLAVAAKTKGSIACEMMKSHDKEKVRIGMPSGVLTAGAIIDENSDVVKPLSGAFFRTARKLFKGEVFL